ncbi:IS630 family transposase [Ruficoccus amylovorans]|uniref:IS630 family transposase n=1 Tax=Ruficoccus amylovorans TaxID=1804625 RepID=UPI0031B5D2F3
MAQARRRWKRSQGGLDPARLVFIDESAAKTNLTRLRGRAPRAPTSALPCSAWTLAHHHDDLLGRLDGTTACMSVEGAANTEVFQAYVLQILVPSLRPGDIVIMDNLRAHKNEDTLNLIRQAKAQVRFLPAYSPDLNPIEMMWSKLKAILRKIQARNYPHLLDAIANALADVSTNDVRGWFTHCGYSFI